MKSSNLFFVTIVFITFCGCINQSKKKTSKYTDYDRGYYFLYHQNFDSAFLMFSRYVNNADDTLNKGKAYRYMGEMLWRSGDFYGAQDYLNIAVHTLDALDAKELIQTVTTRERTDHTLDSLDANLRLELGTAYNISGNVYLNLKLYDEAINEYDKAIPILKGSDYLYEPLNGKAVTFQKKGNFIEALAVYDSIALLNPGDRLLIARVMDNKAKTKWLQDPGYSAIPEFWSALKIRIDSMETSGLNASYAHLSDYYQKLNPDSAIIYAKKMLVRATENKSPDDRLEAMDKLILLSTASVVKDQWYREHSRLSDSLKFARDTAKNRFGKIRYDFQQERTDKLLLQQHVTRQWFFIFALIVLASGIITSLYIRQARRKKRMRQEVEGKIRHAKLKTSQKVHDVVANSLYRIMNELEHTDSIDKELLLDNIEVLYEKSRDISYEEIASGNNAGYDRQVHDLLNAFANKQTKVIVVGNQPAFWDKVSGTQKEELQLVLNDIMINMSKHSNAKNVVVAFKLADNRGIITYKDNGVGFPTGIRYGNGLKNTVSRIKSLNGEITFGKSDGEAVSIEISFPVQPSKT